MTRVLIIPEDPVNDQYILKPLIEALFADLGQQARVDVLTRPRMRSVSDALDPETLRAVIARERHHVDLFLLLVDRDCDRTHTATKATQREAAHQDVLLACLAVEEVEMWMLAPQDRLPAPWKQMRQHCDPKEAFAEPWLRQQDWGTAVGGGRKQAMRALSGHWQRVRTRCEELQDLQERIREWLAR